MKLEQYSACELGALVNSKQLRVKEVLDYFRHRIDDKNPAINAIVYQNWDDAYADGDIIQAKVLRDGYAGPFAGVPIALKDFLPSKQGWPNTHGGVKCLTQIDPYDSEFYKACKKLGAIAIGKTNAPPFGFSGACLNKLYGQTHNPFNLEYNSGGSSGGSAAAVASGMILIGEGGDAGGSIRIPSAWCNLFGFKPSLGSVPNVCRPDAWAATHPYCAGMGITKTVEDAAVLMNAMYRYDPRDPMSLPINSQVDFTEYLHTDVSNQSIALTYDFDLYEVDFEIKILIDRCMDHLKDLGLKIDLVNWQFKHTLEEIMYCWCWAISLDTYLDIYNWQQSGLDLLREHAQELYPEFISYQNVARDFDIHMFRKFNEIRTDILDNFENQFAKYDFIISPTTASLPMQIEDNGRVSAINNHSLDPMTNFISFGETALVNFVGYPAASVPAGLTASGLPVGVQIIGKQYHDADIIRLSSAIEDILPWKDNYNISYYRNF